MPSAHSLLELARISLPVSAESNWSGGACGPVEVDKHGSEFGGAEFGGAKVRSAFHGACRGFAEPHRPKFPDPTSQRFQLPNPESPKPRYVQRSNTDGLGRLQVATGLGGTHRVLLSLLPPTASTRLLPRRNSTPIPSLL
ncbi:hypothetical protein FZEAL_2957 [Fusarium zealandicum]|uniref:Uncharacterized protein n=1 Tax=Fusarium zealandicum TaxID=1053134 RepID=A0A8H4XN13_9HYPO|nr:hypothetical protein FZEAL_2957 [Fusarium zealandicum]